VTFSLLGRCERTGQLGMAVSSSSPAVAARCAFVRARVGAAATQSSTDPRLGPALLDRLAAGASASAAAAELASARLGEYRQLAALGTTGPGGAADGARTLGCHGHRLGEACVAAGNLLAAEAILDAMVKSFEEDSERELGERLVAGLEEGLGAGGEAGEVRSAGLLVSADVDWPVTDLRVDWHDVPIAELRRLWELWHPQAGDYVTRALDPAAAPAFEAEPR
jgi:uncharacterized Ntn-hydrolase superfamily protein